MENYTKIRLKELQTKIDTCDYNDNYNLINIMSEILVLLRCVIYDIDDIKDKDTK